MLVSSFNRGEVNVLSLDGAADITETAMVDWWFRRLDSSHVVIDMGGVTFIDAAMLGCFARWGKALREQGGDVVLVGTRRSLKTIFRITKFDQSFQLEDDLDIAVRRFYLN